MCFCGNLPAPFPFLKSPAPQGAIREGGGRGELRGGESEGEGGKGKGKGRERMR